MWSCGHVVVFGLSCEVVVVPYVDALVDVTVMSILLFVLHGCQLRESDDARLTAMLVWRMDEVW